MKAPHYELFIYEPTGSACVQALAIHAVVASVRLEVFQHVYAVLPLSAVVIAPQVV